VRPLMMCCSLFRILLAGNSENVSSSSHMTSLNWALNANSPKTAKDTDFKFGVRVSNQSPDMIP